MSKKLTSFSGTEKNLKKKNKPKIEESGLVNLSRTFLSSLIIENVTDAQLNILIDNWDFEKETKLIYSGIQVGLDGKIFTMLNFQYKDDISEPVKEILKIIFDDKDKVVGIQPIKLQGKTSE